ncbi:MAG TPA: indolepyruvate oxidoreductase subunit beta family protein [Stellaceae bacterium]
MDGVALTPLTLATDRPFGIAILAMGGQGGGVLSDWIVALAESQGWHAQSTSIAGVAQRTGATLYYIEMLKARDGLKPILSLMPSPGDVDVVVAAEWMEAGRSVLRGLVTPDRTVLVASTHRALAISEKERPGDAIAEPVAVTEALGVAARRTIAFDMQALAEQHGTVISASLFGALAGAHALPFPTEAYIKVIRAGGRGVEASVKAFEAAAARAADGGIVSAPKIPAKRLEAVPASAGHPKLDRLLARIRGDFPETAGEMLYAGARRVTDFQDAAYGAEYLDRVAGVLKLDHAPYALTQAAAKYIAVAMAYDDIIRVADLKTRGSRFDRVRREVNVAPDQILYMTEFMHPRAEEIVGMFPRGLGRWVESRQGAFAAIDRLVNKGRRLRTGTIRAFLMLYFLGGLRRWRRRTLRHAQEQAHLESWLRISAGQVAGNYDLAVEILNARRLVKGYSDTHARGLSKFDRVMGAVPMLATREDGARWMRLLVASALQDEAGTDLDGTLKTIATL